MKRFLRTAVILLCVAGVVSSCKKDKDEDNKGQTLVGTTWISPMDRWTWTIKFIDQSSVLETGSEDSGKTFTSSGTYSFKDPKIVITLDDDHDGDWILTGTVTGNTMILMEEEGYSYTFTKQSK